jgi:antitoxin component YwqK of YwqJK toxin-antitoxin module
MYSFSLSNKHYVRIYHDNGSLKAKGWVKNERKIDYWFEYNFSGQLIAQGNYSKDVKEGYWYLYESKQFDAAEGYYNDGEKTGWWVIYINPEEYTKTQYINGLKHGISLYYKEGKSFPYKADRFIKGEYKGTWTSLRQFKKDNPDFEIK